MPQMPCAPIAIAIAVIMSALSAMFAGAGAARAETKVLTFDVSIDHGVANTPLIRVTEGDAVHLRFSSDRPIVLHLHGYDIEKKVEPGTVTDMEFIARATGRFPIEEHREGAHGGHSHGERPLVSIEVYPR